MPGRRSNGDMETEDAQTIHRKKVRNIKIKIVYEKEEELERILEKFTGEVKKIKKYKTEGGKKAYIELKDVEKKE